MEITTKFGIGEWVHVVSVKTKRTWIVCNVCDGTKHVHFGNDIAEYLCPKCLGRGGEYVYEQYKECYVSNDGIIGQVQVTIVGKNDTESGNEETEVRYMLDTTGVGSGTVWYEKQLFSTKAEAQEYCDKENSINKEENNVS